MRFKSTGTVQTQTMKDLTLRVKMGISTKVTIRYAGYDELHNGQLH